MIIPLRTDRRLQSFPLVNVLLITANIAVYIFVQQSMPQAAWAPYMLDPRDPGLVQFISYQFLHAVQDPLHLVFNMLFLYVFGNSVEDRLGRVGYLGFYLAGGVLAGLGHAVLEDAPVLGASGAVCAVTGAYLALFPLSNVTVLYWLIIIGTFEISSIVLILLQIGQNLLFQILGVSGVAYAAHLAGYAFGLVVGLGLLKLKLLPREPYDLMTMIDQRRRRGQFRRMTRQGYRPWAGDGAPESKRQRPAQDEQDEHRVIELRSEVGSAIAAQNLAGAAAAYARLLELAPGQVMSQGTQVDIGNQFMSEGRYELAGRAYELLLQRYTEMAQREQIELILALLCTRYLGRPDRARELLDRAEPRLDDPAQKELAAGLRAELGASSSG